MSGEHLAGFCWEQVEVTQISMRRCCRCLNFVGCLLQTYFRAVVAAGTEQTLRAGFSSDWQVGQEKEEAGTGVKIGALSFFPVVF